MSKIFHSLIFRFIIVTLVFFAATSPIIVLFGPFGNLKRAVVGAIMRSRHPQYITWLYNQEELNEILGVVKRRNRRKFFPLNRVPIPRCLCRRLKRPVSWVIFWKSPIRSGYRWQRLKIFRKKGIRRAALQRRIMRLPQLTAGDFMIPMVREPAACPMGLSFMKESICSGSR